MVTLITRGFACGQRAMLYLDRTKKFKLVSYIEVINYLTDAVYEGEL